MTENAQNYFFWNKQAFENSIRELVCPKCPYVGPNPQECKNPDLKGCALFRYLPELVRVAQSMESPNLLDYIEAVESRISFHCSGTTALGDACNLLDSPHCGLNKLLPYVLEVVVKTDQSLEARCGELKNKTN